MSKGYAEMNKVQKVSSQRKNNLKLAITAVSVFALSACGSSGNLWQGQEVLVEARQQQLQQDVDVVADNHREIRDRFDALERLYIDVVQQLRLQDSKLAMMESKLSSVRKDPKVEAGYKKVKADVTFMREQLKKLENRVFTVEMAEQTAEYSDEVVPTTNSLVTANTDPALAENSTPASKKVASTQSSFFGVHLSSYRSQDQVGSGWAGLKATYATDLEGLTPLIYTQTQEGVGTFLRLIAGPLVNENEAEALCDRIREGAPDQYCRVSEYQGEPIS